MSHAKTVTAIMALMFLLVLAAGPAVAQTPKILCSFTGTGGACPGAYPECTLTLSGTTLYGTTAEGGAFDCGTVFSLPTSGGSPTILCSFTGTSGACPGSYPYGKLTLSGSTLYGMTANGGDSSFCGGDGAGVIFSLPITGGTPTILFTFDATHGESPRGSLTLSGATLYGMTVGGGGNYSDVDDGFGTIFSLPTTGGTPTLLYSFSGANDGGEPFGSLILSGSTLYGMTFSGGNTGYGTIFRIPATGGSPTILCSFTGTGGACPGANPIGDLTLSGSTLYGMTSESTITGGNGTIFRIPVSGGTPTILYSFSGTTDGFNPLGSLSLSGSILYGMTSHGGTLNLGWLGNGTVFCIPTSGGTPYKLITFGGSNGQQPGSSLTLTGSTLYGSTSFGGNGFSGFPYSGLGTIFSLPVTVPLQYTLAVSPPKNGSVTVSPRQATYSPSAVVTITASTNPGYNFAGWSATGGTLASITSSQTLLTVKGNVVLTASYTPIRYPVTVNQSTGGAVTLSPSQATYAYSQTGTLTATAIPGYSFIDWSVTGGSIASSTSSKTALTVTDTCSVTASYNELFYSSTLTEVGNGTILLSNSGPYTYGQVITVTALAKPNYTFKGWSVTGSGTLGSSTAASTALTVHGNFSLTASYNYVGPVTTLCSFTGSGGACPGGSPVGSLTRSGSTLYGMSGPLGSGSLGTVISIPAIGGTPTILCSFTVSTGHNPYGNLTLSGSTLYGMTALGGSGYTGFLTGYGTVFSLPVSGGTPTVLHSFTSSDGASPNGSLTLSGSTLYGMTAGGGVTNTAFPGGCGTIFRIPTSGSSLTTLYSFSGTSDGAEPFGSLELSGSTLYGMAYGGGTNSCGTIFSIPTSGGTPTILYTFSAANDGRNPFGSLTLSGSTLYGMTYWAGGDGYGTIFSLPTSGGTLKVLYSFSGTTDGGYPYGSLTLSGTTLYGMARYGGDMSRYNGWGDGTIFSIPTSGGTPTILFTFDDDHGARPEGDLTLSGSTLYGMTEFGGNLNLNDGYGLGTVFRLPVTVPLHYTLAVTTPTGGAVTVNPDQAEYSPNELVAITAVADTGSNFVSWSVTGGTLASKTSSQTLLTVTGNVTLSASFHKTSYSDTLTDVGGGKIQMTPSHGPYNYGTVVGLTASANTGWEFVSWSFTGASLADSTAPTTSLTVLDNFDLTANFSAIAYGVSGVASPTAGGTVSVGSATGTIGRVISISRTANAGYGFTGWTLDDGGHGAKFNTGSVSITLGASNVTVTAGFALIHYPVTVHQSTSGVVTLTPTQATYIFSQTGTLTATATTSYNFVSWSVTGGSVASNTSSQTVLTVTGTCTVTASYHKIVYSDTLTDVGGGTILLTPSHGPYYLGTVVGLTASANAGWKFVSWSTTGGSVISSSSSKTSLTVDGDFDVTANFSAITYGVSAVASPATGGTVNVDSATGTIGQVVSISQTANAGYSFTGWKLNDGGHGAKFNSGSASITLGSSNVTVTASYAADLLNMLGFDATISPSTQIYSGSATINGRNITDTVTTAVIASGSSNTWTWSTSHNVLTSSDGDVAKARKHATETTLVWHRQSDGIYLTGVALSMPGKNLSYPASFAPVRISPSTIPATFTNSTMATLGDGVLWSLTGKATIVTTLGVVQSVTVPAGTFKATIITIKLTLPGSGWYLDVGGTGLQISCTGTWTQTMTFYTVPGVGIVKASSSVTASGTEAGVSIGTHTGTEQWALMP